MTFLLLFFSGSSYVKSIKAFAVSGKSFLEKLSGTQEVMHFTLCFRLLQHKLVGSEKDKNFVVGSRKRAIGTEN